MDETILNNHFVCRFLLFFFYLVEFVDVTHALYTIKCNVIADT